MIIYNTRCSGSPCRARQDRRHRRESMAQKREPVIQVKNLYKIYRVGENKVRALNGVDLTIYRGEFCSIVGTSGSGKSTMLNMLAGLEKPTKGEIVIAGQHLEKMNENQLVKFRREHVGFIFQSFNLLGTMDAVENVALPLMFRGIPKKERMAKADKMLDLVGLSKHKDHRPNEMSGGQQQRVGVARALVLDEATAFADPENEYKMQQALQHLIQNKTVIIIAHRLSSIISAQQIIVLNEGKLVQHGKHEILSKMEGLYKNMWDAYTDAFRWELNSKKEVKE